MPSATEPSCRSNWINELNSIIYHNYYNYLTEFRRALFIKILQKCDAIRFQHVSIPGETSCLGQFLVRFRA